ncbi:MAG: cytochrome C oxidase subunit IV family protein [Chloroflexi bacterium]|nr:cytochrome C oxidase subunit IV family protein [Chloroflexota bacterium]MCH8009080.1 cytochrome C oxidase subunit IV family protein [Chloroflexota bacterium]MCH8161096.1 cytochrome C oxidase subunit IV family protein [Chloroflexota bacterium]
MLELLTFVLAADGKAFFENPAYLLGIPLIAVGALGVLLAMSPIELKWPQPAPAEEEYEIFDHPADGHPDAAEYVKVGLILAVITGIEVAIYYVDALGDTLLPILLVLSALKFVLVILWFMHLRFDNRLLTVMFTTGMVLVVALFVVVLSTLGASLV